VILLGVNPQLGGGKGKASKATSFYVLQDSDEDLVPSAADCAGIHEFQAFKIFIEYDE
jgi:hypothetical protein